MEMKTGKYSILVDDDFVIPEGMRIGVRPDIKSGNRAFLIKKGKGTNWRIPLTRYICGLEKIVGHLTPDTLVVDHINHDTLDNRRENLRVCTSRQNLWGRKTRKGKYRGVWQTKWVYKGELFFSGKKYRVKSDKDRDVVRLRLEALRKEFYGEYDYLVE